MQSSSIEPSLATFAREPALLHSFSNLATPGSNESTLYMAPFPLCCMSYTFLVLRRKSNQLVLRGDGDASAIHVHVHVN